MEKQILNKFQPESALTTMLWTIVGFLSWRVPSYLIDVTEAPVIAPTITFMKIPLFDYLPWWIMSFSCSFVLTILTGFKRRWLIGFIIGAAGYEAYTSTARVLFYMNYFQDLSFWLLLKWIPVVMREWILALLPSLVILPLVSWLGAFFGKKAKHVFKKGER